MHASSPRPAAPRRRVLSVSASLLGAALLVSTLGSDQPPAAKPLDGALAAASRGVIPWKSGPAVTVERAPGELTKALEAALAAGPRHIVVQFRQPLLDGERAVVEALGLTLLNYVSDNAFFAAIEPGRTDAAALAQLGLLRDVLAVRSEWKLHTAYRDGLIERFTIVDPLPVADESELPGQTPLPGTADNPTVAAYVMFHPDVALDADGMFAAWLHGATVVGTVRTVNALVVELPWQNIPGLAAEDAVQWIEPPLPQFSELNNSNRARIQADEAAAPPYSLDGAGVTVMVYDGGMIRASHQDLAGRVTTPDAATQSNHSTHVAGTIGGSGVASGGLRRGMAPGVMIVSYAFETGGPLQEGFLYSNPGDLEADYTEAITVHGADIANNSIGSNTAPNGFNCDSEGNYGLTDTLIDAIARGSTGSPFRIVWANGNERNPPSRCGATYHTTAPPACAKNHITVGALNSNDDSMTNFSSWGPADDGRLKPDISGPGCQVGDDNAVTSCASASDTAYDDLCGTSMSSPTVCGLGALLLQDFRAQFPGQPDFRNSTLKVLLAHTAVDLGNPGPDYQFGYGSVRALPAIDHLRSGNFVEGTVTQGETVSALIVVTAGEPFLKVTLAWDDVPGTPNVDPALVNDLDVRVFGPDGTRYFPWTLGGLANPGAPAVRTAEDHVNNIEQIYIESPATGTYRLEIFGFAVPQGPQPYSIAVTPTLVNCTSRGVISLDRATLACADTASVRVSDCDLNTNDTVVETVSVTVSSSSEPAGESVLLTETDAGSANFFGILPIATSDAVGTLLVAAGDAVSAAYLDADDGLGGTNVTVTANGAIDCTPPIVSDVLVTNIVPRGATISFVTNEPANTTVRRGTGCGALDASLTRPGFATQHTFSVLGLQPGTLYFFAIDTTDVAGNGATDNNGGACYSFSTPDVPDFYTEQFSATIGAPDLAGKTILFTPDGSIDFYAACLTPTVALPTDPAGGTVVPLTNTNALQVALGAPGVQLYGVTYQNIFVSSGGYVTFTASDTDSTETFADHFDTPRISGLFDDLNPANGGLVSWKNTGDRIAVTYLNVAGAAGEPPNTFQIEMFFDGRIQMTWLQIGSVDGIVGLSNGAGVNVDFAPSDLSAYGSCGPRPPTAAPGSRIAATGRDATITLIAGDDGQPDPPGALSYRIVSLPANGALRDAGDEHLIAPGELPYTLVNNGRDVRYRSTLGYVGPDSFQFVANDGGTPPDGGDSPAATISISVEAVIGLPFVETFPSTTFAPSRWATVVNATIDTVGANPPSPPNSGRFNGFPSGADEAQTLIIDLSGVSLVELSYAWQCRGGGESPDANDDLFVEFLRADGSWQVLRQYPGSSTPDMTTFQAETLLLPAAALHNSFRLRIRSTGTSSATTQFDDWFVDDIRIISLETPVASNAVFDVPANRTASMALQASDPNNDPLDYVVLTLPTSGELLDPSGPTVISSAPYTLANGGNVVRYRADLGFIGSDAFTFRVSDGTNDSQPATVSVNVGGRTLVHSFLLTTNPGWATEGLWAYGQPTGGGTPSRDPTSGFTGPNVYGYNLAGNYENNLATPRYLRSETFDCTGLTLTQLRFRRWLGVESASFDHANIQASNNGTAWTTIWNHTSTSAIAENAWSYQMVDLASVADGQSAVALRWGMGPTDAGTSYPGWNIDDVEVWGVLPPRLPGDTDCDGTINFFDIDPFVVALIQPGSYPTLYPGCDLLSADVNRDGAVDFFDIDSFLAVLFP